MTDKDVAQWHERGLYAITDAHLTPGKDALIAAVTTVIRGGAQVVQYRDKSIDQQQRTAEATALLNVCRHADVALIINDDIALAETIQADGVHVGKDDADLARARARLGPKAIIGVSCYNSLERALTAARNGADYVAFGSVFPSPTKPAAVHAPLELFTQAKQHIDIPIVAIGGLTPENARAVIAAGADLLAVVSGVFAATDPEAAARRYTALF